MKHPFASKCLYSDEETPGEHPGQGKTRCFSTSPQGGGALLSPGWRWTLCKVHSPLMAVIVRLVYFEDLWAESAAGWLAFLHALMHTEKGESFSPDMAPPAQRTLRSNYIHFAHPQNIYKHTPPVKIWVKIPWFLITNMVTFMQRQKRT